MFEELADMKGSWRAGPQGPEEPGVVSAGGDSGWVDWGLR